MRTTVPRSQPARPREGGHPARFAKCLRARMHFAKGLDSRLRGNERMRRGLKDARAGARALLTALLVACAATGAMAQDYPTRPITLVVPYAAGGGNDIMARTVAEKMSHTLGQQIVIENRAGAGGSNATRQVARSTPDGYTLVIGGTGTLAINPTLYHNVGYDPRKDFAPVGLIATSALVVLVHPSIAGAYDRRADRARQSASPASSTTPRPASAAASISAPSCSPRWPASSSPMCRTGAARRRSPI